jgi:ATP-dependent DNA helicase PIF1
MTSTLKLNESQGNLLLRTESDGSTGPTIQKPDLLPSQSTSSKGTSSTTKIDPEQQTAIDMMQAGGNVFLSGMAGTGKSTTLLEFIGQSFRSVDVCATTGIAALNLQDHFRRRAGVALPAHTVYRWSGIGLGPAAGQSHQQYWDFLNLGRMPMSRMAAFRRVARCECLVIDEISMLPGRVLDYLNFHFQQIRGNARPFGGIQIVMVGDFLQLPPVAKSGKYDWAFLSQSWAAARFQTSYLTTIHRQDEPLFVEALNNFREGRISRAVADVLSSRVKMFVDRRVVRLMTHNAQVDKWNSYQIGEIDGPELTYTAEFEGPEHEADFIAKNSITPTTLVLKRGARVMVTSNLNNEGGEMIAVNGQCGTVMEMGIDAVAVALDGGSTVAINRRSWTYDPQRDDSAAMHQIPLRPAYALTIHKSQGLTLDRAHIDIRAAREPGQAYVALSRLRSLSGLFLKEWIKGVHVSEAAINFYRNL